MSAPAPAPKTDLQAIRALVAGDMARVDMLVRTRLYSEVGLIDQLAHYIVNSGGKRLRPAVVLLSAAALGYRGDQHINLAAIIEFIHTATLLHDDVVDSSRMRRGRETANMVWGNEASVLVGDFLYSRAFQMMVDIDRMRVLEILADATPMTRVPDLPAFDARATAALSAAQLAGGGGRPRRAAALAPTPAASVSLARGGGCAAARELVGVQSRS